MLDALFGLPELIGHYFLFGLITVLNLLIAAVGVLIAVLLALLPSMPASPQVAAAQWIGWLNWLIPVAPMVGALLVFVGLWVVFLVVRIPLKWVKAL